MAQMVPPNGRDLAGDFLFLFEIDAVLADLLRGDELRGFAVVFAQLAQAGPVSLFGARTDGQEFQIVGERF